MPVFLITGASSGIGEAAARRFAREPGARLVLVARRGERLTALGASLPCPATHVAVDLLDDDAPAALRAHVEEEHDGRLDVLVNNAGAGFRGTFSDIGFAGVQRSMALNFDAQVRVTEALLPLLRASAPSAVVNIASTASRIARPGAGAYSAAKFALAGWSDALHLEERPHGVHVGLVLPGFIATEGFPAKELLAKASSRWSVSTPEVAADAIADCALGGRAERYVPRFYAVAAGLRLLAPRVTRTILSGGAGKAMTTTTRE